MKITGEVPINTNGESALRQRYYRPNRDTFRPTPLKGVNWRLVTYVTLAVFTTLLAAACLTYLHTPGRTYPAQGLIRGLPHPITHDAEGHECSISWDTTRSKKVCWRDHCRTQYTHYQCQWYATVTIEAAIHYQWLLPLAFPILFFALAARSRHTAPIFLTNTRV